MCYGDDYYLDRETWPDFRMEARALLRLAHPLPGARVLEVGCGSGELLRQLRRVTRVTVGIDVSPSVLRLAARSLADGGSAAAVACARAEALPFCNGVFDAVLAQHLVEHLAQPVEALREWRRVLRPGGVLALVTPNAAYPDRAHFDDAGHVSLFTAHSLNAALEAAGFRVLHSSTLFPYLGHGRLARAASIRLGPVARRLPGLAHRGRSLVAAARTDG